MRKATDTTMRNLAMLSCIPRYPSTKSTGRILNELQEMDPDYGVSARTVQRGLDRLSNHFPISYETRGRTNRWFWTHPHALTQIPSMSAPTAFALRLAADYLRPIMPPSALGLLEAYFNHADSVLEGTALGRWTDKAASITRGPILTPPEVPAGVQEAVYAALMENRKVNVAYRAKLRSRAKRIVLNPLGIVVRAGIVYLVATAWDYPDVRHYVLHRMSKPDLLEESARATAGFRLSEYIRGEHRFSYPLSGGNLALRAVFEKDAAVHLMESRLAEDHRTSEREDGRVVVEATVADTEELRWWLLGFGGAVEVLGPESLRLEMQKQARRMWNTYGRLRS